MKHCTQKQKVNFLALQVLYTEARTDYATKSRAMRFSSHRGSQKNDINNYISVVSKERVFQRENRTKSYTRQ